MFVSIRRLALERLGLRRLDMIKKYIASHGLGFAIDKLQTLMDVMEQLEIVILRDSAELKQLLEVMEKYKLTPSDAVIALTCEQYNIDTILTFDEDFKRVPWLKVIP
jgi:predicted nucleic acid-binding protein